MQIRYEVDKEIALREEKPEDKSRNTEQMPKHTGQTPTPPSRPQLQQQPNTSILEICHDCQGTLVIDG